MTTLQDAIDTARQDQHLAVVSTLRADQTIQSSVVNAGVLDHPTTGVDVVGFVTYGKTKLANLRSRPQLCITFRAGWQSVAVEGRAELIGNSTIGSSDSTHPLVVLPNQVVYAAGGWSSDGRVVPMRTQGSPGWRTAPAVLGAVRPRPRTHGASDRRAAAAPGSASTTCGRSGEKSASILLRLRQSSRPR